MVVLIHYLHYHIHQQILNVSFVCVLAFSGFGQGDASLSFPGGTVVKNPPANAGEASNACSIPGLERSPGEGNGNPLQYSCLGNSTARGAWWATIHVGRKESVTTKRLTHTYYPHKVHWEAFHLSLYFRRVSLVWEFSVFHHASMESRGFFFVHFQKPSDNSACLHAC